MRVGQYKRVTGIAGRGQYMKQRTHCAEGHPYEGENLLVETKNHNGRTFEVRRCRICVRTRSKANAARRAQKRDRRKRPYAPREKTTWSLGSRGDSLGCLEGHAQKAGVSLVYRRYLGVFVLECPLCALARVEQRIRQVEQLLRERAAQEAKTKYREDRHRYLAWGRPDDALEDQHADARKRPVFRKREEKIFSGLSDAQMRAFEAYRKSV